MSPPSGTLNRLWSSSSFSAASNLNLYDIFYDQNNDILVAAINNDQNYQLLWFKDFSIAAGLPLTKVTMNNGQPFSIIEYDSTNLWVVGRAIDGSAQEQAFHHLQVQRADGVITRALYK